MTSRAAGNRRRNQCALITHVVVERDDAHALYA